MKNENISQQDWFLLCQKYKNKNYILKKLKTGYPIQYMIGYVDFYDVKINVNKNVLIPRYETEYLVSKAITIINKYFKEPIKIVDAGTGSGCIAIKLKTIFKTSQITAYDISKKALYIARKNAQENKVKIIFKNKSFLQMNDHNVDVLISNPPYIGYNDSIDKNVKKYEPHLALFAHNKGLTFYEDILKRSLSMMKEQSIIMFEIGKDQGNDLKKIINNYYPKAKVLIEQDLNKLDRYIIIMNNL